jgi:hypothetical protein
MRRTLRTSKWEERAMKFPWQMKSPWQMSRMLAIAVAALVVAGAVAIGRPQAVSPSMLGAEWQCSRTVLFVTTCLQSGGMVKKRAES